jgi:hypothetical protein
MKTLILHNRHFGYWPLKDAEETAFPVYIPPKYRKFTIQALHLRLRGEHENPPDLVITVRSDGSSKSIDAMVSYLDDISYWGVNFALDLSPSFVGTRLTELSTVITDLWGEDIGQMSEVTLDVKATYWLGLGTDIVVNNFSGQGSPVEGLGKRRTNK